MEGDFLMSVEYGKVSLLMVTVQSWFHVGNLIVHKILTIYYNKAKKKFGDLPNGTFPEFVMTVKFLVVYVTPHNQSPHLPRTI